MTALKPISIRAALTAHARPCGSLPATKWIGILIRAELEPSPPGKSKSGKNSPDAKIFSRERSPEEAKRIQFMDQKTEEDCARFLSTRATTDACGSVHAFMPAFKEVYPDVRHGFHSIRREPSLFVHEKAVKW
jgi:hypothetical protein